MGRFAAAGPLDRTTECGLEVEETLNCGTRPLQNRS